MLNVWNSESIQIPFGVGTPGFSNIYLIKTDSLGDTLWTKTYGGSGSDSAYAVLETSDNGYIVAGYTNSFGAGGFDVFLIHTDADGDTVWTQTYGTSGDEIGRDIDLTYDGGFVIAGYTDSYGAGLSDMWLIRANSTGEPLWTFPFGGEEYELGYAVIECSDGSFLMVGQTGTSYLGEQNLYLVHVPANPPTTPTTPTTPTGPIDLGFLLTIIIPVAGVAIALTAIMILWRRRKKSK